MASLTFPEGFLWGSATASHQVEGGNSANDWWHWEQQPGRIKGGDTSGEACGWWAGRAEEDLALAREWGHNAHRLSLEWSRLEPSPGRFDEAAFARYRAILEHMQGLGLASFVTLNHFTLPLWASRRGGWVDEGLVERFARYAEECARRLGGLVGHWATLNEPSVLTLMAYLADRWPPGAKNWDAGMRALRHQLQAHAAGYRAVHRVLPDARVGLVHNAPFFEPHRPGHPGDRAAAWAQDYTFTGVVLDALRTGRLGFPLRLKATPVPGLEGSLDFFGLNYYGRFEVRFDPRLPEQLMGRHVQEPSVRLDGNDWGQVSPRGLEEQLVRLGRLGVPLYVTENGLLDPTDTERPRVLVESIAAVHRARARGADVRGYFHWSLMDNFEWAEGWRAPFGLFALEAPSDGDPAGGTRGGSRGGGARIPKRSAHVFADIARANALTEGALALAPAAAG
jgi:beta-glucosidase